eukprot:52718-Chlamydomonas_euryale.AAC.4
MITDCQDPAPAIPHVRQVLVPAHGCRVIIASDGLWDVVSTSAAARLARSLVAGDAAKALTKAAAHDRAKVCFEGTAVLIGRWGRGNVAGQQSRQR